MVRVLSTALVLAAVGSLAVLSLPSPDPEVKPLPAAEVIDLPTPESGWPTLFGPGGSISSEAGLRSDWPGEGPEIIWRQPVGTGYSSPVASENLLIIQDRTGDEERLQCLDAATGNSIWEFRYPTSFECRFPPYTSGPYSTPVIAGERVYAIGVQGQLHCLALTDGSLVWRRDLLEDFQVDEALFGVGASPLIEDGRLILNVGDREHDAGVVAFDCTTGETIWTATDQGASYATAVSATMHGRRMCFVFTAKGLLALDPSNGGEYWSIPFQSTLDMSINACSPVVWRDMVLVTIGPGPGSLCIRVLPDGSYEELWRDPKALDSTWNNRVCINGFVYGFSAKRVAATFRCVELETGDVRWQTRSELRRGSFLAADGHFLLFGEYGHLGSIRIDPNQPIITAMTEEPLLQRPCYSAPALHRGRLYLRNEEELLCLDVSARDAQQQPAASR